MQQLDDYETSIRICACGEKFSWAGWSDKLQQWMRIHAQHCNQFQATVTIDGHGGHSAGAGVGVGAGDIQISRTKRNEIELLNVRR